MDLKQFKKKDGSIVQLIDKDKIKEWPVELPLIFIEYVRNNQLKTYNDPKIEKEIELYLDEILEDIAIPGLINVLDSEDQNEVTSALNRIDELAKKKLELVKPIKPYLEDLVKKDNKDIANFADKILQEFSKAERRKQLAEKRKIMRQKEKDFLSGKISGEDYAKARKEYLLLKE